MRLRSRDRDNKEDTGANSVTGQTRVRHSLLDRCLTPTGLGLSVRAEATSDRLVQEGFPVCEFLARALVDRVDLPLGGCGDALIDRQGRLDTGITGHGHTGGKFLAGRSRAAENRLVGQVLGGNAHDVHDEHERRVRGDRRVTLSSVAEGGGDNQLYSVTHVRVGQAVAPALDDPVEREIDRLSLLEGRIENSAVPQSTHVVRPDCRTRTHERTIALLEGLDENLVGRLASLPGSDHGGVIAGNRREVSLAAAVDVRILVSGVVRRAGRVVDLRGSGRRRRRSVGASREPENEGGCAGEGTEAAQGGHHGKVFFRLSGRIRRRRRCSGRWGYQW